MHKTPRLVALSALVATMTVLPSLAGQTKRPEQARRTARAVPARQQGQTLHVAPDGSGDARTIVAALRAAEPGATITIAPGIYVERLMLINDVTLRGAGWQRTILQTKLTDPLIEVDGPRKVRIENLRVHSLAAKSKGSLPRGGNVLLRKCSVEISRCVISGGNSNGIVANANAELVLRDSLVEQAGNSGVVAQQGRKERVHIIDCDIRDCGYAAVRIRQNCDNSVIERCRIAGSGFHGIRYDNCSPQVLSNVFDRNQRTAIYASGRTHGTVVLNLFLGRPLTCWFHNRDTVLGNTFYGRLAGIRVAGAGQPSIRRNLFLRNTTSVRVNHVGGTDVPEGGEATKLPPLIENLFWRTKSALYAPQLAPNDKLFTKGSGNIRQDPQLDAAAKQVYTPRPNSFAHKNRRGVQRHIPILSPWPDSLPVPGARSNPPTRPSPPKRDRESTPRI